MALAPRGKDAWRVAPLSEACEFKPPKSICRKQLDPNAEVSFVPMNDLGELVMYFEPKEIRTFGEVVNSYTYFADGDVLCAKITPCFENRKLGIARGLKNGVGFGSSEFVVMRTLGKLLPEFLYYFLSRDVFCEAGVRVMSGAVGHKRVPNEYFETLPIPLPPLDEQKRIVAVLDQAFAALDRARAHAEANLADATRFMESYVERRLAKSAGAVVTLQELLDTGAIVGHLDGNHGGEYPRKDEFVAEGVPYISANCIDGDKIDFDRAKYLTPKRAARIRKGVARNGDVLFAHNATVGPVVLLRTDQPAVILSTSLTYYRCEPTKIIPEFLVYEMRGAGFRRQYEAVMEQATRSQVPITTQRRFVHTIPSVAVQQKLAEECAKVEESSRKLSARYAAQLSDISALRQSLLQKAFAGGL